MHAHSRTQQVEPMPFDTHCLVNMCGKTFATVLGCRLQGASYLDLNKQLDYALIMISSSLATANE